MALSADAQKMLLHIWNEINSTEKGTAERVNLMSFGYTLDQVDTLIAELKRNGLVEVDSYVSSPIILTSDGISQVEKQQG